MMSSKSKYQAIFDKVLKNLRKQGKPSVNRYNACQYLNPQGLSCAIGGLLSPEQQALVKKKKLNGKPVDELPEKLIEEFAGSSDDYMVDFLNLVQRAHDTSATDTISEWRMCFEDQMRQIAVRFKLKYRGPARK